MAMLPHKPLSKDVFGFLPAKPLLLLPSLAINVQPLNHLKSHFQNAVEAVDVDVDVGLPPIPKLRLL